ncbi:DUF1883 domain-containing protein [Candidatus Leptofilum sp.]|uniref:DUF1883 domain-containing protein n=1 Tax=Candidatus Leptofilum sp. TaxID=3241576 RepID=UPI003B5ABF45
MKFNHYNLGYLKRGTVVEVTLKGSAANVRLMDSTNFQSYKSRRRHRYFGGLIRKSPARLVVPSSGHWHVTVDMQGLKGQTRSAVRIIPREAVSPLPEYSPRSLSPLVQTRSSADEGIVAQENEAQEIYDVFISHATEDKDEIVRPLANALLEVGLRIWYDEFELRIGDSLRRKIDAGLSKSRFGIVVLSHAFFSKNWSQYELDGLVTREMTGEQVILPLWHRVTKSEVISYSPSLADKVARSTADFTIEEIAQEIANVINDAN